MKYILSCPEAGEIGEIYLVSGSQTGTKSPAFPSHRLCALYMPHGCEKEGSFMKTKVTAEETK